MANKENYAISLLTILMVFVVWTDGERKARRNEFYDVLPKYDIYPYDQLPHDRQISTFLYKGETKTFYYLSLVSAVPISITINTCTSPVSLSITYSYSNNNTTYNSAKETVVSEATTSGMKTLSFASMKGVYNLNISTSERDTYVHLYVSTEMGGPQALQYIHQFSDNIKLTMHHRKNQLSVKWDPSLVDPHVTGYCLVVSTRMHYASLCMAQTSKYGVIPPIIKHKPLSDSQTVILAGYLANDVSEPIIRCVGSRTHCTLTHLQQGQKYYLDLFAMDRLSNFTYPHGRTSAVFDSTIKPVTLKDGKSTYVNLKKFDGKVLLRFKVGRKSGKNLELYLMPCGGAIDVEISLKRKTVELKRGIEGFGRIVISNPKIGARYYIKIITSYKDELMKQSGVELYCTTKSNSTLPLPIMPFQLSVKEYVSLRSCDSVTIGWYASPSQKLTRYCLVVKEGRLREAEGHRMPNQCGLENRLRKSADFAVKFCIDKKYSNEPVITRTISQLKPRKSYIVQVTAKKPKGKTLSYELLQVHTKPTCSDEQIEIKDGLG